LIAISKNSKQKQEKEKEKTKQKKRRRSLPGPQPTKSAQSPAQHMNTVSFLRNRGGGYHLPSLLYSLLDTPMVEPRHRPPLETTATIVDRHAPDLIPPRLLASAAPRSAPRTSTPMPMHLGHCRRHDDDARNAVTYKSAWSFEREP
jgi:hypothetical protein